MILNETLKNCETGEFNHKLNVNGCSSIVSRICSVLSERGFSVNDKRIKLIEMLCNQENYFTAEDLWLSVYQIQKISISAIYVNLGLLEKEGIIEKYDHHYQKSIYRVKTFKT